MDHYQHLTTTEKLTCIYGKAGTGKTTYAMMAARDYARQGKKVLFFDTEESFSIERFKQMANDYENLLDRIIVIKIKSFKEQQEHLNNMYQLLKKGKFSILVIDSMTSYYRTLVKNNQELANSMLKKQLSTINDLPIPTVITTQVYTNQEGETKPTGGKWLEDNATILIKLENTPRIMHVIKPEEKKMKFTITDEGITLT
ncbi:MAG TPA: ATPase domain-containing protein [Candidatus Nanoarchaeia archaeon]|nr:ATPase domain-containing protein [Candidatus Nanoarchaeia archaeon]